MAKTPPKKRLTQAQRREKTQALILETAMQILATEGYSNFSSSGVATRAGVSRGALEHYYPKKIDLVAAACQHAMNAALDEAKAFVRSAEEENDPISTFLASSERFFFAPGYLAQVELLIAARADPELEAVLFPIIGAARSTMDALWAETLEHQGHVRGRAERFVQMSHYLLRGMFFVDIWLPSPVDRGAVLAEWRKLAPTVLTPDSMPGARRKAL
ncbi:MAG: TetR/AcrR family transcriptional regulator [Qingshengfaniella sp.]